jgi:hypothetical protein
MLDGYIYNALRTPFGRHAGEVPVMLSVVRIVLRTRGWNEHARTV